MPSTGAHTTTVLGHVHVGNHSDTDTHSGGHIGGGHVFPGGGHPVASGGHPFGGGHGALPFTGFDSLKLALIALVLVGGGLLLMRMVVLISNDR